MPSEKQRYLKRNQAPMPPVEFTKLRDHLPTLGAERLAGLLWHRAEDDVVLNKSLMVMVGLQVAQNEWDKAKAAIDYALHFPNFVRYTESGHGQILDEIKTTLEHLTGQNQQDFALRVAEYAIERAQEVAENFEDDWDWTSSLKRLEEWVHKMRNG